MTSRRRALLLLAAFASLVGCQPSGGEVPSEDAGTSPNQSARPATLASVSPLSREPRLPGGTSGLSVDSDGRLRFPDAGAPPPTPIRPGRPLTEEPLARTSWSGIQLSAEWRWRDVPSSTETDAEVLAKIAALKQRLRHTWYVEIAEAGRMRIRVEGDAFPLPKGTELRARADRYGSILVWPDQDGYRPISPGGLRTLMDERRLDVTPLSTGTTKDVGGTKRLGMQTRGFAVSASLGTVELQVVSIPELGEGGSLLCRAMVELVGAEPKSAECQSGEVVVAAKFNWELGRGIDFEVTELTRRTDLDSADLLVPPPNLKFRDDGLPEAPGGVFVAREDLDEIRKVASNELSDPAESAPAEGLRAENASDRLMYILLDGIPVSWVKGRSTRSVVGPKPGIYSVQWRSFLGLRIDAPVTMQLPASFGLDLPVTEAPDAG